MKKRTQRIIVIVLAVALALSVLLPALSMLSGAVTQSDIDNLKDQISANEAQITQVEARSRSNWMTLRYGISSQMYTKNWKKRLPC